MALLLKLPPTRTAERLLQRMEELNLSIGDLSEKVGTTYEHVRSLLRGKSIPSKLMVQSLAKTLRMDKAELERLATADRIRAKFGKIPLELSGKNPELEPLERLWDNLSQEHKADLIAQAEAWARRDREAKKH
jgi:transcriptional regulator with XRE-family HTH domain